MRDCMFKNFKECYYLKEGEVNYVVCTACLLSRIEKTLFRSQKGKNDVSRERQGYSTRTERKD